MGQDRLPPCLRDPHPRDLDPASATANNHALAVRSREPSAHEVQYLCGRKATCPQDRLSAAVRGGGEQFERAAVIRLGQAGLRHGAGGGGEPGRLLFAREFVHIVFPISKSLARNRTACRWPQLLISVIRESAGAHTKAAGALFRPHG